jgi:hypothetical protein
MNPVLNQYLLNDLSSIVIEYVKFSDNQLSLLMNETINDDYYVYGGHRRYLTAQEREEIKEYKPLVVASCRAFDEDNRLSLVLPFNNNCLWDIFLMVNTKNFAKYVCVTTAVRRIDKQKKHSIHFHGSSIVVADDDTTFRVYDFDLDFT